ncbi:ABC transporter permease [Candidatus Woesearchaeota archaeon]|nr:ABC transporter permease [Candidatus Woesearchaeota archaeon]
MKLKKCFKLSWNILIHSKLRSWLTIIGIIIGIAAVVSIVSISQGAQQQLEERLGSLGADILTISPGASRSFGPVSGFNGPLDRESSSSSSDEQENLTSKDILVLKNLDNIQYVMGQVSGKADMTYLSKTASVSVTGVDESVWKDVTSDEVDSGRFLVQSDSFSVVLGGKLVENTFENKIPLNSKITIEGKSFKVVGILTDGNGVYMPLDVARTVLEDVGNEEFSSISVKIENVEIANETVGLIEQKLMFSRGILNEKDMDFSVSNPAEMQATIQETTQTMSLFLGAIAAISLLVGAIGIANTMFTSVLEKTKEIGIMKAIGAKNKDVLFIFLFNSGLIGLVGGIGGVILGVFGSALIGYWSSTLSGSATRMFGNTALTPELLIGSLLFSILIGMIAGAIPAYRASKLNPVDALRYQ